EQELEHLRPLAGVAVEAKVRTGATFQEPVLFTHRGLSGPAILQASSYWREGEVLRLDLLPAGGMEAALRALRQSEPRIAIRTALARYLPEKLARYIDARLGHGVRHISRYRVALFQSSQRNRDAAIAASIPHFLHNLGSLARQCAAFIQGQNDLAHF
uniref:NAD(P)/FAD-dependent oxidoreductase n=1 Tax=Falsirhodobacter sp. alg1 TaxID=1472418 RepID=UPI001EDBA67B